VVPEVVFKLFSKWYPCKTVIKRTVIKYKAKKEFAKLQLGMQPSVNAANLEPGKEEGGSYVGMPPGSGGGQQPGLQKRKTQLQSAMGAPQQVLTKQTGDMIYELELFPRFIYFLKISDEGMKPYEKAIMNKRVDLNYVKKTLKMDKVPFNEVYLSKSYTVEKLIEIISNVFEEKKQKARIWLGSEVVN
jgi:hypothetical protein